ncbi:hypothetical protein JD844_026398 [Phrynosoma platyrhinos]|uniref:ABC-type xenobiotic transporter n=1 Tax=Phrynosoma platyrhinos TaxID=52577 RepID=A0ABQ7SES9_PHRPL|nr:hypothetical protein JD844_026398 [Phrynosoma platyrhinos]
MFSKMRKVEQEHHDAEKEDKGILRKRRITFPSAHYPEGSTMTFHKVSYRVKIKTGYIGFRKEVKKMVLRDVSGVMKPGLNAILGPTGSGKSSIIDDIVMGTLTVRENLEFSAALRLPLSMSSEEKRERVDVVLKELDLAKVADVKVGTYLTRGVSGGERKRTSIGLELITHPTVLMGDQGKTIIFSIHQPRYSIFKLFNSLTLLAAGRLIYHGPAENTLEYFKGLGYVCEPYNNPADFLLDIINGDSTAVEMSKTSINTFDSEDRDREHETIAERLGEKFSRCGFYKAMREELDVLSTENKKKGEVYKEIPYTTPFLHQLKWVCKRTFKNLIGNPQNSTAQLAITTFLAIVFGAVYAGVKNDKPGMQNRVGAFFFVTTNQCLNSVTTVELFITEKRIFIHEYISGYYRVSAFFLSKILADMVPMRTLPGIILTSLNYFIIGKFFPFQYRDIKVTIFLLFFASYLIDGSFKPTAAAFFIMTITIILVAYASSALALAIATGQDVTSVANLLINICFVFMIVFSGLLVNLKTITPGLLWFKWFSIPRYGLNALLINEFTGLKFCRELPPEFNATLIRRGICTGEEYLETQGIDPSNWSLFQNHIALIAMTVMFLTMAYLKLRFLKKYT